jgi:general secretion pathway protein K
MSTLDPQPSQVSYVRARARRALAVRRLRRRKGERGVALLMVMGTLTILTVMLTEFQDSTSAELGSSIASRDQVRAEYAARSAVNLTRLLLAAEPTIRGPLALLTQGAQIPVWEFTDVILGAFNDVDGSATFEGLSGMRIEDGRNLGLEDARFEITVVDEDSKINLNQAARAGVYNQKRMEEQVFSMIRGIQFDEFFLEALDEKGNPMDRLTVCSALVDWVDPDVERSACDIRSETAQATAPEDSYYQLLDRPFARKNAAFDSLEELHLVQGVSDEFWNTFLFPDPDNEKSRVVTVWGGGKVNVNSANARTLLALVCHMAVSEEEPLCIDPLLQQSYLMTFEMFSQFMVGMPLFPTPDAFVKAAQGKGNFGQVLANVGIPPVRIHEDQLKDAITTESKVFSIFATGYVKSGKNETRSRIHAVVDMRGVPPPGTVEQMTKLNQLQRMQADDGAPDSGDTDLPSEFEAGGLVQALVPRPGGSILYWRVD